MITVLVGWATMAFMAYLIYVTARTIPKIWNPYDILGISDVCVLHLLSALFTDITIVCDGERDQNALQAHVTQASPG